MDLQAKLSASRDIGGLVLFRILFGFILLGGSLWAWLWKGDLETRYLSPSFFFKYPGFEWVLPLPPLLMQAVFPLLCLSALGLALGWRYRLSVAVFGGLFTYLHLLDSTNYINHYYLISLLCGLLFFMPAQAAHSLDLWQGRVQARRDIPAWMLYLLRFQFALVYIFAGLAKLNYAWLFEAMPLKIWLLQSTEYPLIGPLFRYHEVHFLMSWGGALYDLSIVGFLLWGRSRRWAYLAVCGFHGLTGWLFDIGLFPPLMIAGTLLFFSPEAQGAFLRRILGDKKPAEPAPLNPRPPFWIYLYALWQLLFPLRPLLYPGDSTWTEQGYRWGWRVMLVEKEGLAHFLIEERGGEQRQWRDEEQSILSGYQRKRMISQPEHLRQYARYLAQTYQERYNLPQAPKVSARVHLGFNNQPSRLLFEPDCDLSQPLNFWQADSCIRVRS